MGYVTGFETRMLAVATVVLVASGAAIIPEAVEAYKNLGHSKKAAPYVRSV
jgi:hypothetical protein